MTRRLVSTALTFGALALTACGDHMVTQPSSGLQPSRSNDISASHLDIGSEGGVFVSTNGASGNAVVAYARRADGSLAPADTFATGGTGIGGVNDPLFSQGSLTLGRGNRRLYVVNAGSNSISTFAVSRDASLHLLGVVSSRGTTPVSIAVTEDRLYVLNAGDNSVAGFEIGEGLPTPIARARVTVGAAADGASTIVADRDGNRLFVTQRGANAIDVLTVGAHGELSVGARQPSSGQTPFGFAVTNRDQLIVSEASGAVSSYAASRIGKLSPVSVSVSTHQAATCWLVLTNDGRFTYAANAGSGSISGYAVAPDASLRPLSADGRTGVTTTGATPLDMHLSGNGRFLYVLESGTGTVGAFVVHSDGSLSNLPDTPGLGAKAGFQGLAAF